MTKKPEPVSRCKRCNAQIVWAVNPDTGAKVPLDVRPVVYAVTEDAEGAVFARTQRRFTLGSGLSGGAAVSHFATCPFANEFSRANRDRAATGGGR